MKYTTFSKAAFVVTSLLIAAACAESADIPGEPTQAAEQTTPTEGSKLPPPSNSSPPASPPPAAKVCAPSCTKDSDCSSTCPTTSGTACCDVATNTCYASANSCPKPEVDSGTPPPAY